MQGTPHPNIFSVFGRFGVITPQSGDYTFAQIGSTPTTLAGYGITDAQELDADLTALAGLSTTGTIERTGDGTAATYTVTAAAKTVLDDADVSAMRTTLGIDPDYYQKSNILGTVSQSGGVPTGAIFEVGSNANGSYIKFPDGAMFAWHNVSGTTSISTSNIFGGSSGAIYAVPTGTWTYPVSFLSTPSIIIGGGLGPSVFVTTSSDTNYNGYHPNNGVVLTFMLFAFGRWY